MNGGWGSGKDSAELKALLGGSCSCSGFRV